MFIFLEGEEVVAPTTFGTVRMDSINKLKYHGAYDEDTKKADFYEEEEDKVQLWTPNKTKTFEYDTSEEGLYIENFSSRPEDKIREIGDVPEITKKSKSISKNVGSSIADVSLTQKMSQKMSFSDEEKNWTRQNKAHKTTYQHSNTEIYNSDSNYFDNKIKKKINTKADKSEFKSDHGKGKSENKVVRKDTSMQNENEPPKMNAFEYIKLMQKENFEQEKLREMSQSPMSKEVEVKQLGQGVQKRINYALGSERSSANSALTKNKTRNETDDDDDEPFKNGDGLRPCDPKYLPVDINKLSSVEVMEILEKGIIFDKRKYLFKQKYLFVN